MNWNYDVEDLVITSEEVERVEDKLTEIEAENGQQSHQVQAIVAMQTIKHSQYTIDMIADQFNLRRNSVSDAVDIVLEIGDVCEVGDATTGGRKASVYSYIDGCEPASVKKGDWV
jgi:ribosome-associated translation inhibitor RaiA